MTDQGPFRTPDEVLKLNEQLLEKSEECEDLRRECDDLADKLRREQQSNRDVARAKSNNRTITIVTLAAFGLLAWLILNMRQCEVEGSKHPEGACRDAIVTVDGYGWDKCPYANQIMSEVKDNKVRCTCPVKPAGSQ